MRTRNLFLFTLLTGLMLVAISTDCKAQVRSIDDIYKLEAYKKSLVEQERFKSLLRSSLREKAKQGLITNYESLFVHNTSSFKTLDWLGYKSMENYPFKKKILFTSGSIYRVTSRHYVVYANYYIDLNIFIPTPPAVSGAKLGLYKELKDITDPKPKPAHSKKVTITNDLDGTLFYSDGKSQCSLVIKLPKEIVIQLYANSCINRNDLITMAQQLAWRRFINKILS